MSIVVCIFLYISLVGLLVAFFQPYWLVVPNNSEFACLNQTQNASGTVDMLTTNDQGSCGLSGILNIKMKLKSSDLLVNDINLYNVHQFTKHNIPPHPGMCYPISHTAKFNLSCYPDMGTEQCIWYTDLDSIGNLTDQIVTLVFLGGIVLCVFAWFLAMAGCCSLTCCCCNIYTAISVFLTVGAVAMLAAVLLWFGMMDSYKLTDQSCVNVFCNQVGLFDPGSCTIGWSGLLGFGAWVLLVVTVVVTCCTACHYGKIIEEEAIPAKNMVNPYERRRGDNDNAFYFKEVQNARAARKA
eukprot:sb/3467436/